MKNAHTAQTGSPESGKELTVQALFDWQLALTPQATALYFEGAELSYQELNDKAERLAAEIMDLGLDSLVIGISTTRCNEMIVGVLAILKAGKAYLPLDPNYPAERLQQMIRDSGAQIVLAVQPEISLFQSLGTDVRVLEIGKSREKNIVKPVVSSAGAYVLYTSGSTGKPKGVFMGQQALVNLLQWQKNNSAAKAGTKTLQFAPLSFDVSFQEIFATLTTGGTLVLIGDDLRLDPQSLLQFIEEISIERIFLPFVALQFLAEAANANSLFPTSLREVITAGEQLKVTPQLVRFFSALTGCDLYNHYGPTECHVVTSLKLEGDPENWPALPSIGKPISNTEIYILDENQQLLAAGETGELCIGGISLAEGYLNRPELTAEKFIYWLHPSQGKLRIYKTGDLARFLSDGNIELLGRRDEQVKIRGYRIEPGEIEVLLNRQTGIRQAVVVPREDQPGQKRLVAYLISSDGKKDTGAIRHALNSELPEYMIPSAFVWMESLPKTSSGKVDRKSLPKPEIKRPDLSVLFQTPQSKTEKAIAKSWIALLQIDRIGIHDNFFELGGNSLLALQTVAALKKDYSYQLPITKLYQHPTIAGIATFLDGGKKTLGAVAKKITSANADGDIAIIAMAGRFPGAGTLDSLWEILRTGKETISFFSPEELDPQIPADVKNNPDYVRARGILEHADQFDAAFFGINPKLAELMDPQQRIFMEIAWEALESGGYFPSVFKGTIGVFAGSGNNTYYLNNVQSNQEKINRVGSFQVMTANEKDYLASRTAYELNLKGPAVSILSACSTSLLAIAQATEAIRKGQCDLALAGGVAITVPIKSGHIYQEGAMYSRDGHCRTFDADAEGTVFSDGAGVILLKRLEDAVRDGDTIFSVIKGVGLNNDGGSKGSFTAPSAEGQAGAIQMAIQDAGFDPSTISYIEAHGTATPLGDPIEIEGLRLAFGEQAQKQYCAIGSIKSNIGHLTAAAGVAGLIKTSLALHHKKIPASIHFSKPNPHIDFADSPFYVNTELKEWKSEGSRRAGISSFGVGGTNVHVMLEEYVPVISEHPKKINNGRSLQLLNWSAKTIKSREEFASKLSGFIQSQPAVNLADLAYSLQTRRDRFSARRFVIAGTAAEFNQKLESVSAAESKLLEETLHDVAFIFPGQGSQQVDMGRELYEQEPVFKEAVDACAEILLPLMNEDIRNVLYPSENRAEAEKKIHNTYYTQPALFIVEYAMARLWMSWGIQPSAFIGHSIGEFVAAHLSGVFSLADGLRLIFSRGRLMSSLPGGSMLGVRASRQIIEPLLTEGISLAAINSPGLSVVSGPEPLISAFSSLLSEKGIAGKLLQTSHAFHSAMMDPVLDEFEQIASSIPMQLPRIPIVSTLTGKWVSDAEITSAAYWSKQLRSPVRFSDAVQTLSDEGFQLVLETGPGRVLGNLVRQQGSAKPLTAISSMDMETGKTLFHAVLKALGQLWLNGVEPDWSAFYAGQQRQAIALPSYAYDRLRFWVDPVQRHQDPRILHSGSNGYLSNAPELIPTPILPQKNIMRKSVLINQLKEMLENASGIEMSTVTPDMNFIEIGFDSLLLTQIALNIKKEFSVPVSFRQLNETYGNLDLLASYLDSQLPKERYADQTATPIQPAIPGVAAASGNAAISLITQQIQLLAQQVALLQNGNPQPVSLPAAVPNPVRTEVEKGLTAEEINELKKPFGATAKIEKQATSLTPSQKTYLENLIARYTQKTRKSKAYTQEHRRYMADPRVVSGFKPATKEIVYSLVVNKSKGSRLWDIDGNEYVDALNGFGSNFLGYQPEVITQALKKQIDLGYELGPQHELAGDVCKLICEFTRFERSALCNTGSEAVLGAMRIARTVTGRSTIVAFSGSYHGIVDEVIVRGTKKLKSFPAAPGIMPEAVQNMLILDYGTPESLAIIRERAHEFAAILVEPVQSRRPEFQPVEFLKELRRITEESGAALIFDEVITGFRMHAAGAQGIFGIQADLGTYGKVVAGGLPIGVIAGKKLFMDALDGGFWQYGDESTPESGVTYFAGTFVRHPLALAASKASLEYMKAKGPSLQENLTRNTKRMADAMNEICIRHGLPLYIAQFGSLWKLKWKQEIPYSELLFTIMRDKGVHIWDGFPCFLTESHTDTDINFVIQQFGESVDEMISAGFLTSEKPKSGETQAWIQDEPPIPGARLGRDPEGNPAWFVSDPNRPGKYKQLNKK